MSLATHIDLIDVTGPIYLLIGAGYVAVRRGWMQPEQLRALGRFVIQFCVPAILLRTLARMPIEHALRFDFLLPYLAGSLLAMGGVLAVSTGLLKRPLPLAALQALGASSSNSLFVAFPILLQLVGPAAALPLALVQLVENVVMIPLGLMLADARTGHSRRESLRLTLKALMHNPMILGILAGLLVSALDLGLPGPVDKALGMLAGGSAATALFVVGGSLAGLTLAGMRLDLTLIAGGKLLLHPLCVGLAMAVWPPAESELRVAALVFASVPMMSIYPVLGQRFGHEKLCAGALLAATLASIVTVNGLLAVLPHLGFLHGPR
jgi:predicted permease